VRYRRAPLTEIPDLSGKQFLFIGGLHRSGTSILHRLFCEHPVASGFYRTGVAEDEGQHLQTIFKTAQEYGGAGEYAFHPDAHLTESSSLIMQSNKELLLRQWCAYYDLSKTLLLEKSPPNLIRSRFLREMVPAARFVFIVRHPAAVSLATEKWTENTIDERLLHWHTAYSIMLEDIDSMDDCMIIRYEDLVAQPAICLDRICDFVGVDSFTPNDALIDHKRKYFVDWLSRYEAKIKPMQAQLPSSGAIIEHFGYQLTEPFVLDRQI
jgi:hypothetical protein